MENNMDRPVSWSEEEALTKTGKFMSSVYGWMMMGVAMSGLVAYGIFQNTDLALAIASNRAAVWGIFIVQFALVMGLSAAMNRISAGVAGFLYFLYSAITGVTLSFIFLIYAQDSIFSMFFLTAFAFGGLSAVGYFTKKDLGPVRSFCMMGLFGMIGYAILAMFLPSFGGGQASMVFGAVGILVFSGLTAYDTQKIKALYNQGSHTEQGDRKLAILGALTLYLDFINLFLSLLRVFGRRR
jgi:FtsH-binding integral membrane protein